jgi:hypothetical protein
MTSAQGARVVIGGLRASWLRAAAAPAAQPPVGFDETAAASFPAPAHQGRVPRPRLLRSRLSVLMKPLRHHFRPPRIIWRFS